MGDSLSGKDQSHGQMLSIDDLSHREELRVADLEERQCGRCAVPLCPAAEWTLSASLHSKPMPASSPQHIPPRHGSAEDHQLACWRAVERGTNSKFPIGSQPCSRVCESVSENHPWATQVIWGDAEEEA